ncbi:MAG: pyridoxamine 5'-phosphate oxidase family protein [Pelagibacteraceae bacterium]
MTQVEPGFYNNKDLILDEIWALLSKGVTDRNEDFRLPVVVLNSNNGPDARIVVLRGAFKERNTLRFHTDIRSDKIKFIKNNNQIYFLFYNKDRKIQVRATGTATVHYQDNVTAEAWNKTQVISRKCYLAINAPGTISDQPSSGIPEQYEGKNVPKEESEIGYENFSIIESKIHSFEWLYLASKGHRRAKIELMDKGFKAYWVTP